MHKIRRFILIPALLLPAIFLSSASAETNWGPDSHFDYQNWTERGSILNRIELGMGGGWVNYDSRTRFQDGSGWTARLGFYLTPAWSFELSSFFSTSTFLRPELVGGKLASDRVHATIPTLETLYQFNAGRVKPFIAGGVGGLQVSRIEEGAQKSSLILNWGIGAKYFITDNLSARMDVRHLITIADKYNPNSKNQGIGTIGLSWFFGGDLESEKRAVQRVAKLFEDQPVREEPAVVPTPKRNPRIAQTSAKPPKFDAGWEINQRRILFEKTALLIRPSSYPVLDEVAEFLRANPYAAVQVQGHTDSWGRPAYNSTLSKKRALSVKRYMVSKGIASSRIKTVGYGSTFPIASNDTSEGRSRNRRIEFRVIRYGRY